MDRQTVTLSDLDHVGACEGRRNGEGVGASKHRHWNRSNPPNFPAAFGERCIESHKVSL